MIDDPDDIWTDYDPDRIRVALEKVAGTLSPEVGDQIKEDIRRAHDEGTRSPDRP